MPFPGRRTCVGCLDANYSVIILMAVITYAGEKKPVAVSVNIAKLVYFIYIFNIETVK